MTTMTTVAWVLVIAIALLAWALGTAHGKLKHAGRIIAQAQSDLLQQRRLVEEEEANANSAIDRAEKYGREIEQLGRTINDDRALIANLQHELANLRKRNEPRAARFKLEGGMSADEIATALVGTHDTGAVKAIIAHVSRKIVTSADRATDAPAALIVTGDRAIEPYTAENRLHDSGRASAFAETLADLQELTAAQEQDRDAAA